MLSELPRQWIWRGLRCAMALLVLAWAVEFSTSFLDHFVNSISRGVPAYLQASVAFRPETHTPKAFDVWLQTLQEHPDKLTEPITHAALTINAPPEKQGPGVVEVVYRLAIPKDHVLLKSLRRFYLGPGLKPAEFVGTVLGQVEVNGKPLEFSHPEIEIAEDKPDALVTMRGEFRSPFRYVSVSLMTPTFKPAPLVKSRELTVNTKEATVESDLEPFSETANQTRYALPDPVPSTYLFIFFDADPRRPPSSEPSGQLVVTVGHVAARFGFGLVNVVPPLLLLFLIRRYRSDFGVAAEPIAALVLLAVGFELTYVLLAAAEDAGSTVGGMADAVRWLLTKAGAWPENYAVVHNGPNYAMLVMVAVAWPLVMGRLGGAQQPTRRRSRVVRWAGIFAALLFVATWIWVTVQFWANIMTTPVSPVSAWLADSALALLAFPVVYLGGWWVLRELRQTKHTWWYAVLMAVLLVIFTALLGFSKEATMLPTSSAAVAMFCGAIFLLAYARMAGRVFTGRDVVPRGVSVRWLALFILCMAAVPVLIADNLYAPQWYQTWTLLSGALRFTLILVLVRTAWWFKQAALDSGWPECLPAAREAGIVLALIFFFSTGDLGSGILEGVAGYLLVRFLLFHTPHVPAGFKDRIDARATAIAAAIRLNELARATKTLKRELLGKLGKGDITYDAYRSRFDPVELEESEAKRELNDPKAPSRDFVLAFGPTDSAWENGLSMAIYGTAFALPWIVLSLRDLASKGPWYGLLPAFDSALNIVARWCLYGFFMGYFYAYIKGRTGIQKGFWFWFTMVTPAALATGVFRAGGKDAWQGFGLWALEVLITSMLLGLLAGDLQTLRRASYRWRDVLEVHNLGALSAWASALVLALGTALTSLIVSGFSTIATAYLQYSGVLPVKPPIHP